MDIDSLLARHLEGSSSPEDELALRAWLAADPARPAELEALREAWAIAAATGPEEGGREDRYGAPSAAWEGFLARISRTESAPLRSPRRAAAVRNPPRRRLAGPVALTAAAIATLVAAVLIWTPLGNVVSPPAPHTFASEPGHRTALRLPDGSRVLLGPSSSLRVPSRFGRERRVELSGTAYFEVAPDPERPFVVRAGGSVTRVLGTRFVVRAYPEEPLVSVAVEEGRVELGAFDGGSGGRMTLEAGEVAVSGERGIERGETGEADQLLAWTRGRLVFRDRPLAEIARELERWYGVEIRISDPAVADRRLTLSFADANIEDVLAVVRQTLGVEIGSGPRVYVISPVVD